MTGRLRAAGRVPAVFFGGLILIAVFWGMVPAEATAGTIACNGTHTATSTTTVHFNPQTGSCTIKDGSVFGTQGILLISLIPSSAKISIGADNNLDGNLTVTDHLGCQGGDDAAKSAGGFCDDSSIADGTYTNFVTANVDSGDKRTLTVKVSISGGSFAVVNGTVTGGPDPASSGSGGADTEGASRAVQNLVSQSQTAVVGRNVGTRLTAAAARASGTPEPSTDQPGGFATRTGLIGDPNDVPVHRSRGGSLRDLAMLASFDTSSWSLAASEEAGRSPRGPEQRRDVVADRPITLWGNGSYQSLDNDYDAAGDDRRFDGDVWGYNVGGDYRIDDRLVAGVSLGYSETDLTTTFNGGTYDETTWTLSPYAMYRPSARVTLSAVAGYGAGDVTRTRGAGVRGETDSAMWFASLNGAYTFTPAEAAWDVTADLDALVLGKTVDAFTESDGTRVAQSTANTRRLKPGLEVAYGVDAGGTTLTPFAEVAYVYDFTDEINGDSDAAELTGGLRLASGETGLVGVIEGTRQVSRDSYTEYAVNGLIAYGIAVGGESGRLGIVSPYADTRFATDHGRTFETGVEFASDDEAFECAFGVTHSPGGAGDAVTAARLTARLSF